MFNSLRQWDAWHFFWMAWDIAWGVGNLIAGNPEFVIIYAVLGILSFGVWRWFRPMYVQREQNKRFEENLAESRKVMDR